VVLNNLDSLCRARNGHSRAPFIETQFLNFGYNSSEIKPFHELSARLGVDRSTLINIAGKPSRAAIPGKPKRCFWLWCVLTVDWQGQVKLCANSWTFPYPRLSLLDHSVEQVWRHTSMVEARRINISTREPVSPEFRQEARCLKCAQMLYIDDTPEYNARYVCE
jgi:hypothetical protein